MTTLFVAAVAAFAIPVATPAAPEGFEHVGNKSGCELYLGPVHADGTATLRAECAWPDVDYASFQAKLARNDAWHHYLDCLTDTRVVGAEGDRQLVWQRQEVPGVSPREDQVWMWSTRTATGWRYSWEASPAPFAASKDAVVVERNEGFWEVSPLPGGGVHLVNETTYDPGGWIPLWLVRALQGSASADALADLREVARGERG